MTPLEMYMLSDGKSLGDLHNEMTKAVTTALPMCARPHCCGKTSAEMTAEEVAVGGFFGNFTAPLRGGLIPLFCSRQCAERSSGVASSALLPLCSMCGERLGAQYATTNPPDGRMFCSNGCLMMANAARSMGEAARESQDKSAIAILEAHYPSREPVAPWARSGGGQNCTTGFNWTTRQWDDESHYKGSVALYSRPAPHGGGGNQAVCEACAERAGVFGPVDAAVPDPPGPLYPTPKPSWPDRPTCAGPLATHGTPVLRVMGDNFDGFEQQHMCDACYLHIESEIAEGRRFRDEMFSAMADDTRPPACIGTVPQSIGPGAGIGIWASRGMR